MRVPDPLTPFEELMFYQDSQSYPCSCYFELQFSGKLTRSFFEQAVQQALVQHPFLTATVAFEKGRPRFVHADPISAPKIYWLKGQEVGEPIKTCRLDLTVEPGFAAYIQEEPEGARLLLQFHHACCDGLGFLQFVNSLLSAYTLLTAEAVTAETRETEESLKPFESLELPIINQDLLLVRNRFGLNWKERLKLFTKQLIAVAGIRQFLMRSPKPITPRTVFPLNSPTPEAYPVFKTYTFEPETTRRLRQAAGQHNVTVNDLLTRDLFIAQDMYRQANQLPERDNWFRLMIPMSLRRKEDRYMPATNIVSAVFLDRRGEDYLKPKELLDSIHEEMALIKRYQLGFTFLLSLVFNRLLPGGVKKTAESQGCKASAVFTNLGKVLQKTKIPRSEDRLVCGDVTLEQIYIAAPFTASMPTAFTASWYAKKLSILLHYDSRVLNASQAEELISLFVREIKKSADKASHPTR